MQMECTMICYCFHKRGTCLHVCTTLLDQSRDPLCKSVYITTDQGLHNRLFPCFVNPFGAITDRGMMGRKDEEAGMPLTINEPPSFPTLDQIIGGKIGYGYPHK